MMSQIPMQYPCKHCAQHHHANGVIALNSSLNRLRQSEQKAIMDTVTPTAPATATIPIVFPASRTTMTLRKKDRTASTSLVERRAATNMPSDVFNDDTNTEQSDNTIAFDNYHQRTITNTSRTCWLNGNDGAKSDQLGIELPDDEYAVCNDRQNISISGVRRQSHAIRTVTYPSTPQIKPPSTCIQNGSVHLGPVHEITPTTKATIGANTQVSFNRPMSSAGVFRPNNNVNPITTSTLQPCSLHKTTFNSQTNNSPACFKTDQCSGNGFKFHRRQNRWMIAMASVSTISHVLLFCLVFAVFGFGSRSGMVHANDLQRNSTNITKFSPESGSKYFYLYLISLKIRSGRTELNTHPAPEFGNQNCKKVY